MEEENMETFVAVDDSGNRVPVQVVRSGDNLVIFLNEGQSIEGVTEALTQGMTEGGQGQYQIMVTDNYQEGQGIENIQQTEGYEQVQDGALGEVVQPDIESEPAQTYSTESYQQYQVDELGQVVQPVQVETVPNEGAEQLGAFVPAIARGEESEVVNTFIPASARGDEANEVTAYVSSVASGEESEGVSAFVSAVASGFQEPVGGGHPIGNLANVNIPIDSNFQLPVTQYDQNTYVQVESSVGTSSIVAGQYDQSELINAESSIGTSTVVAGQLDQSNIVATESVETQAQYEHTAIATAESGVGTTDAPEGALEIDLSRKTVQGAAQPIEVITSLDDLMVSQPLTTTVQDDRPFIATKVEIPRVASAAPGVATSLLSQKPMTQPTVKFAPVSKPASSKSTGVSILLKCEKCDQVFFTASELKAHRDRVHGSKEVGKIPSIVVDRKNNDETELGGASKNLCSVCHIICPSLQALIKHKHERHGMAMPFKCDICTFSTTQKKYLDIHMRTHQKLFNCPTCKNAFDTQEKLNRHASQHARDKYQCFYCQKMYLTRKACTDHIALKHSAPQQPKASVSEEKPEPAAQAEPKPTPPPVESNESSSQTEISNNLLEELDQTVEKAETQTEEQLNVKEKEVELDTPAYIKEQDMAVDAIADDDAMADDDGIGDDEAIGDDDDAMDIDDGDDDKDFKTETDVEMKMGNENISKMTSDPQIPPEGLEDFTPIKNRDFQCLACYGEFSTELLFQNHYLKEHTQENMCLVCGRDFTKRFLLRCHFQETHCCKDVYKCKNCDKMFNMVQKYWRHATVHARRYVCSTCDRAFGIPSELKRHQMSVHAEKMYFCVYCPETFSTAQDLRKHKEVAHNLKSYTKREDTESAKADPVEKKPTPALGAGTSAKNLIQQAKDSGSQMTIKIFRDGTYMTTDPNTGKSDYGTIDLSNLGLDPALLQTHNDLELVIIPPEKEESASQTAKESTSELVKPSPVKLVKNIAKDSSKAKLKGTFHVEKTEDLDGTTVHRKQIVPEGRSFGCKFCPRTFRFYRHLRCHENAHGRSEKYECHICQRMFVREANLKLHLDLHKKKDISSPDVKKAKTIKAKTPENFEGACDTCGKVFNQKSKLNRHIKDVHESQPLKCHICQKVFRSESNVQRHMKTHYGPFACTYCTEIYKDKEELNTHVKEQHQMKLHNCHICNKDLFSFGKLLSHLKLMHPDDKNALKELNSSLKCDICQKQFTTAKSVRIHRLTHTGEKKFQCPHCPWKFYLAWKLKKHMSRAHENAPDTNKFPCEMCMKDFFKETALKNHEAKVHPGPYQCNFCKAKPFTDREKFKQHCDEKHSGNCVVCDLCELPFSSGRNLQIHELHSHLKTHLCDLCGYSFSRKDEMQEHLKFNHFGGDEAALNAAYPNIDVSIQQTDFEELRKTLQCTRCGKVLKKYSGLMSHMKSCNADGYTKQEEEKEEKEVKKEEKVPKKEDKNVSPKTETVEYKKLRNNPTCTVCGKSFKNLAAVVSHMRYCGKPQSSMKLKVKIQKYSSPVKVKRENEDDVTEDHEYVPFSYLETGKYVTCDQCHKTFSKRESLKKHLLVHAGIKRKPDKNKSVISAGKRKIEIGKGQEIESNNDAEDSKRLGKSVGKGSKKLYDIEKKKCEICNILFTTLFSLKRHMQRRHPEAGLRIDSKLGTEKVKVKQIQPTSEPKTEEEITQLAKNQFLEMNFSLGIKSEPSSDLNSPVVETVKNKRHDCNLCGSKFSREATLKKHMAEFHFDDDIEPESDSSSEPMEAEEMPSSPIKTRRSSKTDIMTTKVKTESEESAPKSGVGKTKIRTEGKESTPKSGVGKIKIKTEGKESTPKPVVNKIKTKLEVKESTPKPTVGKTKVKKEDKSTPKPVAGKTKIKMGEKGPAQKSVGKTKANKGKEEKASVQKSITKKTNSDTGKTIIKTRSKLTFEGKEKKVPAEKKELLKCKHCDRAFNSKLGLDRHLRYNHKELKGMITSLTSLRALRSQKTFYNLRMKKKITSFQKPKSREITKKIQQPKSRYDEIKTEKSKVCDVMKKNETQLGRKLQQKSHSKIIPVKQAKPKVSVKTVSGGKVKQSVSFKKPATNLKQTKLQENSQSVTKKHIKNQKSNISKKVKKTSKTSFLDGILSQFLKKRVSMILFECDFCERQFTDKYKLNFHRRTKHSSKVICKSICVCSSCGESFSELRAMITHRTSVHSDDPQKNEETAINTEISELHIRPAKADPKDTDFSKSNERNDFDEKVDDTNGGMIKEPSEDKKHGKMETDLLPTDDQFEKDQVLREDSKAYDAENMNQLDGVCGQDQNSVSEITELARPLDSSVDSISDALVLENDLTSQYIELKNNKGQATTEEHVVSDEIQIETDKSELKDSACLGTDSFEEPSTEQVTNERVSEGDPLAKEFDDPVVHDVDMFTGTIVGDDKGSKRAETPVGGLIEGVDSALDDSKSTLMNGRKFTKEKLADPVPSEGNLRQCPTCLKKFCTEAGYLKHIPTHTVKKYECSECDAFFRWKKNCESHMKLFHTENGAMVCEICNQIFYDKDIFERHKIIHLAKKFSCTVCTKKFSKYSLLKDHLSEIHKNPQLQLRTKQTVDIICAVCNLKFSTTEHLLNHMLLLHSPRKPAKIVFRERLYKYKCKFCPLMFKTKESQTSHLKTCDKRIVLARKLYGCELTDNTCSVCGLKFKNKVSTFQHLQTAHGQGNKFKQLDCLKHPTVQNRYSCNNCQATFSKFASYSMHEKSMYGICSKKKRSSKHERCPFCKVLFGSRLILGKHMLKVHNNNMYYSWKHCPYCKQSFARKLNLKKHMQAAHPKRLNDGKKSAKKSHSSAAGLGQQATKKAVTVVQHVESTDKEHDKIDSKYRKIRQTSGIERHKCDYCGRVHWTIDSFEEHLSKYHADRWIEKCANSPGITSSPSPAVDSNEVIEDTASADDNKLAAFPVVMVHRLPVDLLIKSSDNYAPEDKESADKYLGVPFKFDADIKSEGNESGENVGKEIKEISDRSIEDLTNLPDLPIEQSVYCKTESAMDVESGGQKGQADNGLENDIIDVNYLKLSSSGKASIGIPESLPDEILAATTDSPLKREPYDEDVHSENVMHSGPSAQLDCFESEKVNKAAEDQLEETSQTELDTQLSETKTLSKESETEIETENKSILNDTENINGSVTKSFECQINNDQIEETREKVDTALIGGETHNDKLTEEVISEVTLKELDSGVPGETDQFENGAVIKESDIPRESETVLTESETAAGDELWNSASEMEIIEIENAAVIGESEKITSDGESETVLAPSETAADEIWTDAKEMEPVQTEKEKSNDPHSGEIEIKTDFRTVAHEEELVSPQYDTGIEEMQIDNDMLDESL